MLTTKRTRSSNIDFQTLVKALDADLKIRDGEEHDFYHQFYKIDMIQNVVVAYAGGGAVKEYSSDSMEVKRMYVPPQHRGKGIASIVLKELESWCKELGYKKCILETGKKQPEAIELYKKNGYIIIPNYGQYSTIANSVCFEKELTK